MRGREAQAKHGYCWSAAHPPLALSSARRSTCANTCDPPQGLADGGDIVSSCRNVLNLCTGQGGGCRSYCPGSNPQQMMDGFHEDKYPNFLSSQWEKPMPQSCPVGQSTIHTAVSNATVTMNPSLAPFLPFSCSLPAPPPVFSGITTLAPQMNHVHLNLCLRICFEGNPTRQWDVPKLPQGGRGSHLPSPTIEKGCLLLHS